VISPVFLILCFLKVLCTLRIARISQLKPQDTRDEE
jgi:hypothetical protein